MKVALIGFGKMGQMLFKFASQFNIEIVSIIDSSSPSATSDEISEDSLNGAHVCIDFTKPSSVLKNVSQIAPLKKNILIGTTGWEESFENVKEIVAKYKVGFLYGSNFATGVILFKQLVQRAIEITQAFDEYEASLLEIHHTTKKDSPSGTAKDIAKLFSNPIQLHSKRIGDEIAEHRLLFDSPYDHIELIHKAKSRETFALGALRAALWLDQKVGFFQFEDIVKEITNGVCI